MRSKPRLGRLLAAAIGEENLIGRGERDAMSAYAHDASSAQPESWPDFVAKPATAEEVSRIVRLAYRFRVPIVPRGAGTGLAGGAVPRAGGIVLSLERMNRVLEIDERNRCMVAEAGVPTNSLNAALVGTGLFYAGFPLSLQNCLIGGNVSTNAGGGKALKYGVTGRHVLGLELVTPRGRIIALGGKNRKDKAGYDLTHLVVGAEGTLGVVTKVILQLLPRPEASSAAFLFFDGASAASRAILSILDLPAVPSSLELIDRLSFLACDRHAKTGFAIGEAQSVLLLAYEEGSAEAARRNLERAIGLLGPALLSNYIAPDAAGEARIWALRQALADADYLGSEEKASEDIVVPYAQLPEFADSLAALPSAYPGLMVTNCGHAADGNLHTTLHRLPGLSDAEWGRTLESAKRDIYALARKQGGKISGEHGIGYRRAEGFAAWADPFELELMRLIKKAWDPRGIMNPGKIFAAPRG